MQFKSIKNILDSTKTIVEHQNILERIKGEKFNVFSILKMESKENDTHSNFIGELLNPQGSHFKGSIFLKLFLLYHWEKQFSLILVAVLKMDAPYYQQ